MVLLKRIANSFIFWGAWILIPIVMEIVPAIGSFFLLFRRQYRIRKKTRQTATNFYPEISIIIPIYNSENTLFNCIKSIEDSTYPSNKINIFLVNNQTKDQSFAVFAKCQEEFPNLRLQWMNASQGKSRALNLALYNSNGKYIINIDSDGALEKHALCNLIDRFEADTSLNCMTGAILTTPSMIQEYKSGWARLLRNLEFVEYAQAFLAGRSYASEINSVYTLSGAFSAFRKSTILKSRMYNTDTICEDTQLTFQMRQIFGERVEVCENALFLVDPIEDVNKLYTQRQRWQRGSLEVAKMFMDRDFKLISFVKNINVKTLLYDHTFAFPRMIWYLALLCLLFMNYSGVVILYSTILIYIMYIAVGFFYYLTASHYLKSTPELRDYYRAHWYCIFLLPAFNLVVFFIRLAGIINSIGTDSAWRTKSLTDEKNDFVGVIKSDFVKNKDFLKKIYSIVNRTEEKKIENEETIKQEDGNITKIEYIDDKPVKKNGIFWYIWTILMIAVSSLLLFTTRWVKATYNVAFEDILSTLKGNINGTGSDVIYAVIKGCFVPALIIIVVCIVIAIIISLLNKKTKLLGDILSKLMYVTSVILPFIAILYCVTEFDLLSYYEQKQEQSRLFETYYIEPDSVNITAPDEPRNLIFIYLESMETTYSDYSSGGNQAINYMPNLSDIALNNISFSDSDKLGGLHTIVGNGFTSAALFSSTSGLVYKNVIEDYDCYGGVISLGDILEQNGYNQEFMCGSDAEFGGRSTYFQSHGNYEIFDLFTAREQGYIPDDYFVWWGFEDFRLFDMAKAEITRLAEQDEPFNFTMLTVDTHHIGGYVCEQCGNEYAVDTANVVACTDRLMGEFIEWCKDQDFYENTTIVIMGDHPRMDNYLVSDVSYYDRTEYNCFINSVHGDTVNNTNRCFTTWDMFPSTLSSLGFTIEGDRLGLGTDLFSSRRTIIEELGYEWVEVEANKDSDYYDAQFVTTSAVE